MSNTKRLTVQVPTEQHKQFKALCAREGATMSEIVLEMIEHWIEDMEWSYRRLEALRELQEQCRSNHDLP